MDPVNLSSMPGSFALHVGDNVRRYLANATLPDIPLPDGTQQLVSRPGEKSRLSALHSRHERHRRLTYIHSYPREMMEENIRRCKVLLVYHVLCSRSFFVSRRGRIPPK